MFRAKRRPAHSLMGHRRWLGQKYASSFGRRSGLSEKDGHRRRDGPARKFESIDDEISFTDIEAKRCRASGSSTSCIRYTSSSVLRA